MTLNDSNLQSAIETFLGTARPSPAAAAAAFADVYDTYAQGAVFGASTPTLTGRKALFEAALLGALPGTPASIAAAVAAYWAPVPSPVPVVGAQAGTVVGCPGAAGIAAAMAAMFPGPNTRAVAAAVTAGAIHAATLTCTATVTPPSGTILPIA